MGIYSESDGTFLGFKLPEFEVDPEVNADVGFDSFVHNVWSCFKKTQSHYDLEALSPYTGLSYHRCGSEPDRLKPNTNHICIGTFLAQKLEIIQLSDKSYSVNFDFSFPPNIREITADFWIFLNERFKRIEERKNEKANASKKNKNQQEYYYRHVSEEEELKEVEAQMDDLKDDIKSMNSKTLKSLRSKILTKISEKPTTLASVSWG